MASAVVDIGGCTFASQQHTSYPKCLPHAQELARASRQVTPIEIDGTFCRPQSAAAVAVWDATRHHTSSCSRAGLRAVYASRDVIGVALLIEQSLANLPAPGSALCPAALARNATQ